jgi:hypothetical protein
MYGWNKNSNGLRFDEWTIQRVWEKARVIPGIDPVRRRMDCCGAYIDRSMYGESIPSGNGWEIDHVYPDSLGGSDDLANLQPLQWQNNRHKADQVVGWSCAVRAA